MESDLINATVELTETFKGFVDKFCIAVQEVTKAAVNMCDSIKRGLRESDDKHARLYHLATRSKKRRTRKKNMKRLFQKRLNDILKGMENKQNDNGRA